MSEAQSKGSGKAGDELVPTDGRAIHEWESHYSPESRREQYAEGIYLYLVLLSSLIVLFLIWRGFIADWLGLNALATTTLNKYAYYSLGGLVGGTVIGIKFHYHVVAKGYWHEDRRLWRILSPWLSLGVAFGIATLIEAGMFTLRGHSPTSNSAGYIGLGFLIGLFSDAALRMLQRIAEAIFGASKDDSKQSG